MPFEIYRQQYLLPSRLGLRPRSAEPEFTQVAGAAAL